MKWLSWATLGVLCGACGGAEVGRPIAQFPSSADLNEVAGDGKAVAPNAAKDVADVDSWQMQAPDVQAQYPSQTAWDKQIVASAAVHGNRVHLSSELRCAAQEEARFYVQNGGLPDDGLREHLLVRCGSTLPGVSWNYVSGTAPDDVPDAQVTESMQPLVRKLLDQALAGHGEFGAGFARGKGRYTLVAFAGEPLAVLNGFSPIAQGSSVTLTGSVKTEAEYVVAFANQGAFGVVHCEVDPRQRLPAFRITCPLAADDPATRIEVLTLKPGQVLLNVAAELETRRDEQAELVYNAAAYGDNKAAPSSEAFRASVLAALNNARSQASLQPFALEATQSKTDEKLAPYLFQTLSAGDERQTTTITLGLLAGWDVNGVIKNGGIYTGTVNSSRNPSRWLTRTLDSPLGRFVLLDPSMAHIGIGAIPLSPTGMMAIVTTYAFYDSVDHQKEELAVFNELNRQRRAHGVPDAQRVESAPGLQKALAQINHNTTSSLDGLNYAMTEISHTVHSSINGYIMETTDVSRLHFDDSLLTAASLELQVGVTHYRVPGAAWGQYAILFVILNKGAKTSEARDRTPRAGAHGRL
jgi:hypothetical protein